MLEIENKSIFSNLSFLQIIIVIMKFVIYLDYHDIEELNFIQSGGGEDEEKKAPAALTLTGVNKVVAGAAVDMASSTVENATSSNQSALNKGLEDDLSKDKDMKGIKTGFINNNWIFYIVRQATDIVTRVAGTAGEIVSRLFMIFIFAATFPALPFFAVMGLVYAFAKYGAFKIRGL